MGTYRVKLHRSERLELDDHPESCTVENFRAWCTERVEGGARLAIDLFSGAGGLSLGITQAGWTVAASVDNSRFALRTHRANFPGLALDTDLGDPTERRKLVGLLRCVDIDLVAGGPPCQPFSRAGRSKIRSLVDAGLRTEHDERRELWRAYLDVVLRVRPRAALMENVPEMALGDDFHVVRTIIDELEEAGYRTDLGLVDAWRYGVPQHRKRLILLARRDSDEFNWPESSAAVTLREAIDDLPELGETTGARELEYEAPPKLSAFAALMRKDCPENFVWDHMTRPVRDDDRKIFEHMTSQTLYSEIKPDLRRYKADTFDDKYKRLDWNARSRSITAHIAKDGYWYIHPEEHRTLTVREAARIQTFPDWFRFVGNRSHAFQQIGNAVPPLLGQAAASALHLQPDRPKQRINQWRLLRNRLTRWAEKNRQSRYWCLLPGPQLAPVTAAVVTLLEPGPPELRLLNRPLAEVANNGRITEHAMAMLTGILTTRSEVSAIGRLRAAQDDQEDPAKPDDLPDVLGLRPGQTALLRLLVGEDVLLTTNPVLRVSARVLGTRSDQANTLTDGRVDLARLVGGGERAPLRMAAVRLVGQLYCTRLNPMCGQCPLSRNCVYARKERPTGLLF
ncbi:DNA cytosine methyltransferase [Saccharopolyspora sp. NFXS83]|uniref:DNA cytosine methyltransferase n=1 Tax=Saccharopolyspora sp. NFXS83 TaxID=2993560 RepID=UPI00224AD241|nr:DNA cytosine methyltransferase [Saccharopolyspora sp. NFXS83]MCX2729420.1 DNA cytosine methyltransferase [Saccharopolyspora sp. NFXS83]